jgi:hypothetical protein
VSDKVTLTPGVTFGYTQPTVGADMTYVRPEISAKWIPTEKLTVTAEAGTEQRRFDAPNLPTLNSPVYRLEVGYRPFPATSLTLGGSQGTAVSYFGNSITQSRSWNAALQQRLFGILYATLTASGQKSKFVSEQTDFPITRKDRYTSYEARLGVPIRRHGVISVFYRWVDNESSATGYAFTSHQLGVEARYAF